MQFTVTISVAFDDDDDVFESEATAMFPFDGNTSDRWFCSRYGNVGGLCHKQTNRRSHFGHVSYSSNMWHINRGNLSLANEFANLLKNRTIGLRCRF